MKTVLITGGHKGLGLSAVKCIAASRNHDIILAGRNLTEIEEVAAPLRKQHGIVIQAIEMDTSSMESVRLASSKIRDKLRKEEIHPLQVIICNAGVNIFGKPQYNSDGHEKIFATNHLGHFLLVNLLIDEILPSGRIIITSSGTHDPETADGKYIKTLEPDAIMLANEGKTKQAHSSMVRYSTSKLCNILFAYELERRLKSSNTPISSTAYDPGAMTGTELGRNAPFLMRKLLASGILNPVLRLSGVTMGSVAFSGESLARLAIASDFQDISGKYFQSNAGNLIMRKSSGKSYDLGAAKKLWQDSEILAKLNEQEKSARLK